MRLNRALPLRYGIAVRLQQGLWGFFESIVGDHQTIHVRMHLAFARNIGRLRTNPKNAVTSFGQFLMGERWLYTKLVILQKDTK